MKHTLGYKRWTPIEDDIMRTAYPQVGASETTKYLPGRTVDAVKMRARHLALHRDLGKLKWDSSSDALLTDLYPNHTAKDIAKLMGRASEGAIYFRAMQLGLRKYGGVK